MKNIQVGCRHYISFQPYLAKIECVIYFGRLTSNINKRLIVKLMSMYVLNPNVPDFSPLSALCPGCKRDLICQLEALEHLDLIFMLT